MEIAELAVLVNDLELKWPKCSNTRPSPVPRSPPMSTSLGSILYAPGSSS
jgi:hypothetical protein